MKNIPTLAVQVLALASVVPVATATVFHANELYKGGPTAAFSLEISPDLFSANDEYRFGVADGVYGDGDEVLAIGGVDSLLVSEKGGDWSIVNSAGTGIKLAKNAFSFVFLANPAKEIWEADSGAMRVVESIYDLSFASFPYKFDFLAFNVTSTESALAQPIPPAFALFGSVLAGGAFLSRKRTKGRKA